MTDAALVKECEATAAAAQLALGWIADPKNDPRVGQDRAYLERSLRNHAYQARRLARSVERPMCIGVFGPSQAGKSYLVSVLARKGESLTALFADDAQPEVDFIKEINPYGEKEATGLVTRFSIHKIATPKGYPVALRLLTQTDILKILANSYFFDTDLQDEPSLTPEDIDRHIAKFEAKVAKSYIDILREEDVWDVEDYFLRQIRRTETRVFAPFWDRVANAAPRLGLAERAELFSIFWGRHQPLTGLYLTLVGALEKMDFAEEAYCPLEALIPATHGILNVETLAGLDDPEAETLKVMCPDGAVVELPRPVLTALAAELRMVLKDNPWPFFEHTDLLDFPGYRNRTPHRLAKYFVEAKGTALKELFLRGKVDYLFQRYTAEQELTSMLLCLRPSNLDVTTLPAVIDEWIGVTHGRTPDERRGRPVLLFFLLTMFDQHLAEKVSDEGTDAGLRFQTRLEASLLKPFAKVPSAWPLRWTPEAAFQNCYWIRNPNYKAEGVIHYEGRTEMRVLEQKVARIAELREAYARVPEVNAHFHDPLRAFDEVMRLNDGGISYLAENLAKVCKAGMKQAQVRARLTDVRAHIAQTLRPYFVPTDSGQRPAERTAIAEQVISEFDECIERQKFGSFLRGLCLDRERLADALYEARTRGIAEESEAGKADQPAAAKPRQASLLAAIKGAGQGSAARSPAGPLPKAAPRANRRDILVRCALQVWSRSLHETIEDGAFAATLGVTRTSLREMATEIIATSRRLGLENVIRTSLNAIAHIETAEQDAAKATIVAERHINRFVTHLGMNGHDAPIAYDASAIGEQPVPFQQEFVVGWFTAFYGHVQANATSGDGLIHDRQENLRLGQIIQGLEGTVA
jgi:hypothetical protein